MERPTGRRRAFTLVEMLVVVFIIGILVTIVVGVARTVFRRTAKDQTMANMEVILSAVEEYGKINGEYPPEATDFSGKPAGWTDADWRPCVRVRDLYQQLEALPQAQDVLAALNEDATPFIQGNRVFADGFGNHMDYRKDKGVGGTPLLVSAGSDREFATQEDNIRSDDR